MTLISLHLASTEIRLAFTMAMPPYLIEKPQGKGWEGFEYEIIKETFSLAGDKIGFVSNVHYKRALILLKEKKVDAVVVNSRNKIYHKLSPIKLYPSKTTLNYVDCVISLKRRELPYRGLADLSKSKVVAFKTASLALGKGFQKAVRANEKYSEAAGQELHPKLLLKERTDYVVSDKNIFAAHLEKAEGPKKMALFNFYPAGKPTPRGLLFTDPQKRDRFNKALKQLENKKINRSILLKSGKKLYQKC